jgi:glycosyltransferase involved in cell wall biosynthesis
VDAFLAVTKYYAARATELFDLPASRVYPVPLGVRFDDIPEDPTDGAESRSGRPQAPFTVGYLARICPDKGLHLLSRAVRILRGSGRACRLAVAGYLGKADRPYMDEIRSEFAGQDLAGSFEYVGQVDRVEKIRFLRSLDVLSVPTIYREAKGLFVLEALSQGVPVVEPRHGSFPELIEATGGGLLFPPQDARSLAEALGRLMDDPQLRHRLGRRGREAVRRSFSDEAMARAAWSVFERASASGPA